MKDRDLKVQKKMIIYPNMRKNDNYKITLLRIIVTYKQAIKPFNDSSFDFYASYDNRVF
jgi:hypothetical protein